MSAGRSGVKPPNGTWQDHSLVHVLFLLTALISCCEAVPSWMETVALALEPVRIPARGIFSRQPCRWHSEPCLSKPREQPWLPFPSVHGAAAAGMGETFGTEKEAGVIRWLLKHPVCSQAVSRTLLQTGTEKTRRFLFTASRRFECLCATSKLKLKKRLQPSS